MASGGVNITTDSMAYLLRNKAKEDGCEMLQDKIVLILKSPYLVSSYSIRVGFNSSMSKLCVCMHTQKVLKNTKTVTKPLKWLWGFFSSFVYFFVFSCNSWSMVRTNHS